jgi:pectate lyase
MKRFLAILMFLCFLPSIAGAKIFYLDSTAGNCSGKYSIANRNCAGSDGDSYGTLSGAMSALSGGDTLYIRAGTYTRSTNNNYTGALSISAGGTSSNYTKIFAYPGETPIICPADDQGNKYCQYNPNPGDTTYGSCTPGRSLGGSACYYPNPAVNIGANYVHLSGIQTFGGTLISGNNFILENCDLGGGGPNINQGQVLMIAPSSGGIVRNNRIHNSAWGESNANGSALMGYDFSVIIENNEFYNNWSADIRLKDTGGQAGKTTEIRYNFFRTSGSTGVEVGNQDMNIGGVNIYNNVFIGKSVGIDHKDTNIGITTEYNNTFINCKKDIYTWVSGKPTHSYNNLFYHASGGQSYYDFDGGSYGTATNSEYNMFYTASGSSNWATASSFSAWQGYGFDRYGKNGINPNFVNPAGTSPGDFKRTSYAGDVSGSPYGTVAGAYETGNELIGLGPGSISPPPPPPPPPPGGKVPDPPSGLSVQ